MQEIHLIQEDINRGDQQVIVVMWLAPRPSVRADPLFPSVSAGRGVTEAVWAVGFCLGSGLLGICNSD